MRKLRIFAKSQMYHFIQRAVGQHLLWYDQEDIQKFISLLERYCSKYGKLYSFALMGNHFHLMMKTDLPSLFMQRLETAYAMYFNRKYDRRGPVFQGRFSSEPIEDEIYMLNCVKYILNNPKHAGHQTSEPSNLLTSFHSYFGDAYPFVDKSIVISKFESESALIEFLEEDDATKSNDIFFDSEKVKSVSDNVVVKYLSNLFQRLDFIQASDRMKVRIAKKLRERIPCSIKQLSRILDISYGLLRRKLQMIVQKFVFTFADLFPDEEWIV